MIGTLERPAIGARADAQPVISMIDVGMTYPNGKVALADVNVNIPAGDFVFLVGPSGAGKSTFIRLLIREQLATSGRVTVAGRDLARMRRGQVPKLRRRIGIVFQDFRLLPAKTVYENVAVPLELAGAPEPLAAARRRLAEVGLAERADHYPAQLSGGEQQRVAIARAVALAPPLLLADEPTGNLDSATGAQIVDLLLALNRERRSTLLLVTHDAALAGRAGRRIALRDGRVVNGHPA